MTGFLIPCPGMSCGSGQGRRRGYRGVVVAPYCWVRMFWQGFKLRNMQLDPLTNLVQMSSLHRDYLTIINNIDTFLTKMRQKNPFYKGAIYVFISQKIRCLFMEFCF